MPGLLTLFTSDTTKREIAEAQRELHIRKKLVLARHRMLNTHVRHALASKKALGVAVASGFVVGQVGGPGNCKHCGEKKSSTDINELLRNGLRIFSLVQTATTLTGFLHLFE